MPRRSWAGPSRSEKPSGKPLPRLSSAPWISPTSCPKRKRSINSREFSRGCQVILGDKINVPFLAGKERLFQVEATSPSGGVIINQQTKFVLKKPDFTLEPASRVSYENIGGLEKELRLVP